MGVSAELRMPTYKGEVPGLPIALPGWGDPAQISRSPVRSFLGFMGPVR